MIGPADVEEQAIGLGRIAPTSTCRPTRTAAHSRLPFVFRSSLGGM